MAQPLVPFADRVDRGWTVGGTAAGDRCTGRVTGAGFHADAPFVDRDTVRLALWNRHRPSRARRRSCASQGPARACRSPCGHRRVDTVDFLHVVREELGDVLIGRPVHRHAEVIAVFGLELASANLRGRTSPCGTSRGWRTAGLATGTDRHLGRW